MPITAGPPACAQLAQAVMVRRMISRTRIRTSLAIVLVAVAPITVAACGDSYSSSTSGDIEAGAQATAQGSIGAVSVEQAHDQLEKGTAVMVDVREPEEIAESAVPGTINIPLGQLDARASEVPTGTPVLVFCRSGNRSQEGAAILAAKGYDASTVEGGIIAWSAAGLPTT
jgi:rhodanese-related sulfurtransferase